MSLLEFKQEVALALIELSEEDVPFPPKELIRDYYVQHLNGSINMHSQCARDWISWCMAH